MNKSKLNNIATINSNLPVVSNGSLEDYINYVNSIPFLTQSEEFDLAEKWYFHEDIEAARYLVLSHLRLVVSIARSYNGYGLALADIIQEGTIGLMKAVKKFDPSKGFRLVTFATYWIKAEINDYVIKNWRIVKTVTTKNQRKLFFNLRSKRQDIGNLSEEEANKIAEDLGVTRNEIIDMNMRLTGDDVALLKRDEEDYAPEMWLEDYTLSPEVLLENKFKDKLHTDGIKKALLILDERSQDIIKSRWLLDKENQLTLTQIAKKYNISAERVRQIELKAMQQMKEFLQNYE
jgi:RNA polymerase sigma-32 factor